MDSHDQIMQAIGELKSDVRWIKGDLQKKNGYIERIGKEYAEIKSNEERNVSFVSREIGSIKDAVKSITDEKREKTEDRRKTNREVIVESAKAVVSIIISAIIGGIVALWGLLPFIHK